MGAEAEALNRVLERNHPAAWRSLSALGRIAAFPRGIPWQANQARGCRIDATIGQLTDGLGNPVPLPAIAESVTGLDPASAFLYAPVDGPRPLREAWRARQARLADATLPVSLPVVSHGLTHALSLVASVFADADTQVLVPTPAWENYDLVFQIHAGARVDRYSTAVDGRFTVDGVAAALERARGGLHKTVLILNHPSNPVGYQPTAAEAAALCEVILAFPGPLVVVTDDAYQGFVYDGAPRRSLFWDLAERADPERLLVVKCDGATKELVFFSSRVGFVTHTATGEAEDALTSKFKYVVRGTVGGASGPALAMTHRALLDPRTDAAFEERRGWMRTRWAHLREGLATLPSDRARVWEFNAAFFALIELDPALGSESIRERLLAERSTGVISFASHNAIRVAYCSITPDGIGALLEAIRSVVASA